MSVRDRCQAYCSPSSGYWKHSLSDIMIALETEDHPDQQIFATVACTLMMNDRPGYWHWLENAIAKLIHDPKSRLEPLPDLPEYEEMSSKDLLDKYEIDDENYPRNEILSELKYRYPLLIQSDEIESIIDLRDKLKDVIKD
ncbi:unnamed protein product [Rotaria sordida]|uniref:Uncharacterized protein n=1 Tax=Rotaria sordida TaxID=392033 RepID=A0A813NP09_9BILA|nr:unnamed protein product [Rotaria sordida]CAF0869498.1 unnamed protein product [Rotaria sordida]